MRVLVKLLPHGRVPVKATSGSAGFDLHAAEDAVVFPGQKRTIGTGVCMAIEEGFEGQVRSRSGIAHKHSCFVVNSPGTIDSDYRGEVKVMLHNLGALPMDVKVGDRIAQLVITQLPAVSMHQVETLDETVRGEGGFGSTGIDTVRIKRESVDHIDNEAH